jgi:hypothetical protein
MSPFTPVKMVRERIEDAMREIGVLLIAFCPLDAALIENPDRSLRFLLFFLAAGASLFTGALVLERRRRHDVR